MKNKISFYYPGFVRRAITFTIDDGNVEGDGKFLSYVTPAGIRGTFNLCPPFSEESAKIYTELYRGNGVADHCCYHPYILTEEQATRKVDEVFPGAEKAERAKVYRDPTLDGFWHFFREDGVWRRSADPDAYIAFAEQGREEIERVFGKGACEGFVWPFHEQNCPRVLDYLHNAGYGYVRKTGCAWNHTNFAVPDTFGWVMNCRDSDMLRCGCIYEELPDDGELKFLAFGLHASDYERNGTWGDLARFCDLYGNRPDRYYYATPGEIFRYVFATRSLDTQSATVRNDTEYTLYLAVDGEKTTLAPGETL